MKHAKVCLGWFEFNSKKKNPTQTDRFGSSYWVYLNQFVHVYHDLMAQAGGGALLFIGRVSDGMILLFVLEHFMCSKS